jgi:VIT1/CCC1 family predicted Fe2+/Mn2+ transporter
MLNRCDPRPEDVHRTRLSGRELAYAALRDTWLAVQVLLLTAGLSLGLLAAVLAALLGAKPRR